VTRHDKATAAANGPQPGLIGRVRSRQAGHPSGMLGRIIGRAMVKDTADANDRCVELLDLRSPATVLELGFGQGRTVAKLLDAGHQVIGADVSTTMVRQATWRNRHACASGQCDLRHTDGRNLPFDDDSAAAALSAHTIYFMPDPAATVNAVARVLRPGGQFVIACRIADDGMPAWMDPAVYRIPRADDVMSLLEAAGFRDRRHHLGDIASHRTHWFTARLPEST
jgi:arsenite methyltransferase